MSTDSGIPRRTAVRGAGAITGAILIGRDALGPMGPKFLRNSELQDEVSSAEDDSTNLEDEQGWEDVETDIEHIVYKSFFDEKDFQDVHSMLQYCLATYHFNFLAIKAELGEFMMV